MAWYSDAVSPRRVPVEIAWTLWDLDVAGLDLDADADSILARVLEHGRLSDVRAVLALYGAERVRRFFEDVAHPIVTERTRQFWRAYFGAEDDSWPRPPSWRKSSAAPWID